MKKLLIAGSVVLAAVLTCSLTVQSPQAATKAKAVKIKSVTAKKNTKVTVKYKKQKSASGYQIKFSTSKSFKKSKTITKTVGKKKTSCSTRRFSAGDTVYVKVRSYKIVNGKKKYGRWSAIKKKTVPTGSNNSGSSANQSDDSTASDSTDSGNTDDNTASSGSSSDSSSEDSSNAVWTYDNTTLTISGTGATGKATEKINSSEKSNVEHIIIEDGITSISDAAFYNCTNLKTVEIADSVTNINMNAFLCCTSLEEVKLPAGITDIKNFTFGGCSSLSEIEIPENVKSIEAAAFTECSSLISVTFPDGLESIGSSAFEDCISLTSVTFPDGLKSIETSAFSGCSSLTSIVFPDGLESIGAYAFAGCSSLTNISIPENCFVDENAFAEEKPTYEVGLG